MSKAKKVNTFADWLLRTRTKRKLSQEDAAVELKVSGPTVCRWEGGGHPEAKQLKRICAWGKITERRIVHLLAE